MPLPFAKSQRSSALLPMCCFANIQMAALLKRRSCSNSSRGGRVDVLRSSSRLGSDERGVVPFPCSTRRARILAILGCSVHGPQQSRLRLTRIQTQVQVSMRQGQAVLLRGCSPVTVASVAASGGSAPAPWPNQSIEGTAYGLRPPAAPHIQLQGLPRVSSKDRP
jgi:hypothetical protein